MIKRNLLLYTSIHSFSFLNLGLANTMLGSCLPLNSDGIDLVRWINFISGSCVYGKLEALSWVVQYISVGVWVFSGTYQSWLCYKTKEVSGFSEYFLLCWITGAVLNTLGCFLADQMFFQKLLGVYFLFSDSFLYFQYKYYIKRPHLAVEVVQREKIRASISEGMPTEEITIERTHEIDNLQLSSSSSSVTPGILLGLALAPTGATAAPIPTASSASTAFSTVAAASQAITTFGRHSGILSWSAFGYFIGNSASWTSNCLYVVSRIPQIRRNYQRQSTDGVSPALFIAVLVGNAAYTLAVAAEWQAVTDPVEKSKFVIAEMPFIVGGIATTLMDLIIFAQLYMYRNSGLVYETLEGVQLEDDNETTLLISGKKAAMYS